MAEAYDIVVAGGGLVGCAFALALRGREHSAALLDARRGQHADDDNRAIALSHGSRLLLERLGVWQSLPSVTPITEILVSQQGGFGRAELTAAEARVPALGYVVGYTALQRTLMSALATSEVDVLREAIVDRVNDGADSAMVSLQAAGQTRHIAARLVAIAEAGANVALSNVKTRDYRQSAVICNVRSERPHLNRAYERFTPEGPLALLPNGNELSLIWTAEHGHAQELATLDDAEFCARLRSTFGAALGGFSAPYSREVFPLTLKYAAQPVASRSVLIGNAAQTLHPVAGQGFNLCLRDAWELAQAIASQGDCDPGNATMLNHYCSQRRFDRTATILFTDSLIRLFSKDNRLMSLLRGCGLAALSGIPPIKNFLTRRTMFSARG